MRINELAAAVVSLSCVLAMASCAQHGPVVVDEGRGGGAPLIQIEDDDPDFGSGIGSEPPSGGVGSDSPSSDPWSAPSEPAVSTPSEGAEPPDEAATLEECYYAGKGGTSTREEFCRSSCPPEKKKKCWSLVTASLVEWVGWCSWNF